MTMPGPVRAASCLLVAVLATWLTETPAMAHGGSVPDSRHYRSTITAIKPPVAGLVLSVTKAGQSLTLTNRTGRTVIVLGYAGEAYLRFTPTGVDVNVYSLSSSLNGNLVMEGLPQLRAAADPQQVAWWHVSDQPRFTWHDHRIDWAAQRRPPVVAADPRHSHKVLDWTVPLTVDGEPVAVHGVLEWTGLARFSVLQIVLFGVAVIVGLALAVVMVKVAFRRHAVDQDPIGLRA